MIPVANIPLRQDPVVLKSKSESFLYYNAIKEKIIFRMIFLFVSTQVLNVVVYGLSQAFVVVSDTLEVMGNGIGNQPHW
jgi:hypothetical protein